MTKRTFLRNFWIAAAYFVLLIAVGVFISAKDHTENRIWYTTFKDLIPVLLAVAATWLGYCIQRRTAYQQQLRVLWSNLVEAVQLAEQYTLCPKPSHGQYCEVLTKLSVAIDEVRGVFSNLGEKGSDIGLYPFEPIKDIHGIIEQLGYEGRFKAKSARKYHGKIFALWKDVRKEILKEFDREEPTFSHSHWKDSAKSRVYDDHRIPKRAT